MAGPGVVGPAPARLGTVLQATQRGETMTKKEVIQKAIEALKDKNGRITPQAVVTAARNKRSPLHSQFEWDDEKAADKQRLDRARELIVTYVTVVTGSSVKKFAVPAYVRDPRAESAQQGYISLTGPEMTRQNAEHVLLAEIERCEGSITRARNVAGALDSKFPGLSARLESLLMQIIDLRSFAVAAE